MAHYQPTSEIDAYEAENCFYLRSHPSRIAKLLPHMTRGGLVVFDDYGLVQGATRAADEACARLGAAIEKLSNYVIPAYFRVP